MRRIKLTPRPDWQRKVEEVGFLYHTTGGQPYWNESAAYEFTLAEILRIEAATNELQALVVDAIEVIFQRDWFHRLGLSAQARRLVVESWNREPAELSLLGRFDLAWNGTSEPKLLEYNADTPTSLLEAAAVQWFWLREVFPERDQFNSLHERLIARWGDLKATGVGRLHLACMESEEDLGNLRYLGDCAAQAGIQVVEHLRMEEIGWAGQQFVDSTGRPIANCFKLYPWEWLLQDRFGIHAHACRWIEPAWKMLLSNKAILPILWELYPEHPNLLPAFFEEPVNSDQAYVSKPFWSREGANITVWQHGQPLTPTTPGTYENEPLIYQQYYQLPRFDGHLPVLGSWIIGEEAAGMGIREDEAHITGNLSRFVPHYIQQPRTVRAE